MNSLRNHATQMPGSPKSPLNQARRNPNASILSSFSIRMENPLLEETSFLKRINSGEHAYLEPDGRAVNESYYPLFRGGPSELNSPAGSMGYISVKSDKESTTRRLPISRDSSEKAKMNSAEPKIIITPAKVDAELRSMKSIHAAKSLPNSSNKPVKGMVKRISVFFTGRSADDSTYRDFQHTLRKDPLIKKSTSISRYRSSRNESGRLLSIIARQAINGRNPEVSKTFYSALEKVNSLALQTAKTEEYRNKKKRFFKFLKKCKENFYIFLEPWKPDSILVVIWNIIIILVIVLQSLSTSYIVCFLPSEKANFDTTIFLADFIGDILYVFEIISHFQIGYYFRGELHCTRKEITRYYVRNNFLLDILTEFSMIGRFLPGTNWQFLMLLSLVRMYNIPALISAITDYFQFSREVSSLIKVTRLSVLICALAHFCGCILYSVTKWDPDDNNWIKDAGLEHKSEVEIYVASLYWSVTTMATVGFGDIKPTTVMERMFVVVVMIISSITFGYILSTIGSLLLEIGTFSSEAREKIRILTKYMSEKGLNKETQTKIRKYLEFYLDRENAAKIEGDYIMKMLSPNLQEEIVREVNAKILSDNYIFSSNFRKRFLYIVSKDLVEKSFGPDEIIFYREDASDSSIYFITSGRVDMCYERCDYSLEKLKKGACFGFLSFFSGRPRDATARSLEFTSVFQLKKEKFLDKLNDFASEKETYFMIKDTICLYENYQYLNLECFICRQTDHIACNCPERHFVPNKAEIIKEYLRRQENFRTNFTRKGKRKFHSLINVDQLQEAASQIQIGHQTEVHDDFDVNDDEAVECHGSYSSIDEILDRRIYDPKPLDYVADTIHMKYLDFAEGGLRPPSITTLNQLSGSKRSRQKVGEIETFMRNNYDTYYHNLNLDRVRNFEVYYPNNNIIKLMVEFEKVRLEKIVNMRLGVKAKHISPLLVKTFKMNEKKKNAQPTSPVIPPVVAKDVKKRYSVNIPRRRDSSSNPSDIMMYNAINSASAKPFNVKRRATRGDTSLHAQANHLAPPTGSNDLKKIDVGEFTKKINKLREKDLSTIREDTADKFDKLYTQGNLSVDSIRIVTKPRMDPKPQVDSIFSKYGSKNNAHVDSTTEGLSLKDNIKGGSIKFPNDDSPIKRRIQYQMQREESECSEVSLESEPVVVAGSISDYSKLVKKLNDKSAMSSQLNSPHQGTKTEKLEKSLEDEEKEHKVPEKETKNEEGMLFRLLLQDRLREESEKKKTRSASEDGGKDLRRVIDKYKLPQIFKKMSSIYED